jgi:hypothetical protein
MQAELKAFYKRIFCLLVVLVMLVCLVPDFTPTAQAMPAVLPQVGYGLQSLADGLGITGMVTEGLLPLAEGLITARDAIMKTLGFEMVGVQTGAFFDTAVPMPTEGSFWRDYVEFSGYMTLTLFNSLSAAGQAVMMEHAQMVADSKGEALTLTMPAWFLNEAYEAKKAAYAFAGNPDGTFGYVGNTVWQIINENYVELDFPPLGLRKCMKIPLIFNLYKKDGTIERTIDIEGTNGNILNSPNFSGQQYYYELQPTSLQGVIFVLFPNNDWFAYAINNAFITEVNAKTLYFTPSMTFTQNPAAPRVGWNDQDYLEADKTIRIPKGYIPTYPDGSVATPDEVNARLGQRLWELNEADYTKIVSNVDTANPTIPDTTNPPLPPIGAGGINFAPLMAFSGLSEVFPFSLPFDFVRLVQSFRAPPRDPVFVIMLPLLKDRSFEVKLDFTVLEPFMKIARLIMLLGFAFMLIAFTPKLIKW